MNAVQSRVVEIALHAANPCDNPFNTLEVDVVFTSERGTEQKVPAFWKGDAQWAVRFAPAETGTYTYQSLCSDTSDAGLHGLTGTLEVSAYTGDNPLLRHGRLRVADDNRHLVHADGTPFFWLADTWWSGFSTRFSWPDDVHLLTEDRVRKGFTVVHIAAGLLPIMDSFDPRAHNEAGSVWEAEYAQINPRFFDLADLRVQHLVENGLLPAIFGSWGYNLSMMGVEKMKQHWRYLVARWGAYPVVWSLAGEINMPWFTSTEKEAEQQALEDGWSEVGRYLKQIDPYERLVTAHPRVEKGAGRYCMTDPGSLDFDMLQTGHFKPQSIPFTINTIRSSLAEKNPPMPVLSGEVCYEGMFGTCDAAHQRFMFWACILSGAVVGYGYGAENIWQFNTDDEFAGKSPDNIVWGTGPWQEAYTLPGSKHLGLSKAMLMRYPWWRIEPHPEWISPHWNQEKHEMPFAGGIPGELRLFYYPAMFPPPCVNELEEGLAYRTFLFDPLTGQEHDLGSVSGDEEGKWQLPMPPTMHDWVLVMESGALAGRA